METKVESTTVVFTFNDRTDLVDIQISNVDIVVYHKMARKENVSLSRTSLRTTKVENIENATAYEELAGDAVTTTVG